MKEDVPDDQTRGRLRAEDRRGQITNQFPEPQELEHTPEDTEESWEHVQGGHRGRRVMGAIAVVIFIFAAGFFAFSLLRDDKDKPSGR